VPSLNKSLSERNDEVAPATRTPTRLTEGVRKLIRPSRDRRPLMETTGTRAAIGALDERLQLVEETLRNLVLEVERIADAQDNDATV
jgi:hypothetical protein